MDATKIKEAMRKMRTDLRATSLRVGILSTPLSMESFIPCTLVGTLFSLIASLIIWVIPLPNQMELWISLKWLWLMKFYPLC